MRLDDGHPESVREGPARHGGEGRRSGRESNRGLLPGSSRRSSKGDRRWRGRRRRRRQGSGGGCAPREYQGERGGLGEASHREGAHGALPFGFTSTLERCDVTRYVATTRATSSLVTAR